MKRSLCISVFTLLFLKEICFSQNYATGDTLNVVAHSGLRLRTSPNGNSGTIRILEYGDLVKVQNTFEFDSAYQDKSGWLQGHWIYVNTNQVSGYVFDAYLSTLDVPSHENELCMESSLSFSAPLQEYIAHHFPFQTEEQGLEHGEDVDQCVKYHTDGVTLTKTVGNGWYKTDVTFEGYRLGEVVNLFRSMIVGDDMHEMFEDSLKFYKNKEGQIHKILTGHHEYPMRIAVDDNGMIHVSITDLTKG